MIKIAPKLIIFDWDGTLADTRPLVVSAMENTLAHYQQPKWDIIKKERRDTTKSLKENFSNFFGEFAKQAYDYYLKTYVDNFIELSALTAARATLEYFASRNIPLAIVSNKEKSLLLKEVNFLFPDIPFYEILGNGDVLYNKPDPAPVIAVAKKAQLDIETDEIWLIGDSKQDTECAYNAGCVPILIGQGLFMDSSYVEGRKNTSNPLRTFTGFEEFLNWAKKQEKRKKPTLSSST